jgi:DNA-binding transcriptional regulator YiaG
MSTPDAAQIIARRKQADLTQKEAAQLIYSKERTWQDWEAGVAKMHAGLWELFCIKTYRHVAPAV